MIRWNDDEEMIKKMTTKQANIDDDDDKMTTKSEMTNTMQQHNLTKTGVSQKKMMSSCK